MGLPAQRAQRHLHAETVYRRQHARRLRHGEGVRQRRPRRAALRLPRRQRGGPPAAHRRRRVAAGPPRRQAALVCRRRLPSSSYQVGRAASAVGGHAVRYPRPTRNVPRAAAGRAVLGRRRHQRRRRYPPHRRHPSAEPGLLRGRARARHQAHAEPCARGTSAGLLCLHHVHGLAARPRPGHDGPDGAGQRQRGPLLLRPRLRRRRGRPLGQIGALRDRHARPAHHPRPARLAVARQEHQGGRGADGPVEDHRGPLGPPFRKRRP
mmetsp:Transcript_11188/g.37310  ORF Transcript_11188/g.37310 Transcript_11188/m.37310 type:complete len:265 (-) Transcript_11188:651-1445(-)